LFGVFSLDHSSVGYGFSKQTSWLIESIACQQDLS